jgi:hypothetical protein
MLGNFKIIYVFVLISTVVYSLVLFCRVQGREGAAVVDSNNYRFQTEAARRGEDGMHQLARSSLVS